MTPFVSVSCLNPIGALGLFGLTKFLKLQVRDAAGSETASCSKALNWKVLGGLGF